MIVKEYKKDADLEAGIVKDKLKTKTVELKTNSSPRLRFLD